MDRRAHRVPSGVTHAQPTGKADQDAAFRLYVVPELDVLLRVALSITRQPADAEDLVQDTVLRAYRSIDTFDGAHPRAWLLTILRNAEVNRHRRRRPELMDDPVRTMERAAAVAADDQGTPEGIVLGQAFDDVVEDALQALPDRYRRVVMLVDVHGLSYAEAAQALGVPAGTVMSRLHRARGRIRTRLVAAGLAPKRGGM